MSTSGSRTAVAAQNGAKTQVTGLVGAAAIALMLLFAPGLLRNLPQPTLAAVVIAASLSLADIAGMRRLWRQRKSDFALATAAFLGVALLGVLPGIGLAVVLSILDVFSRAWRPYQAVLGRVPGLAGYHDTGVYPNADLLPGLVIFRFDGPLFFANANTFRDKVLALADSDPRPQWILVAAEPITDIDTTAADMLEDLDNTLNNNGVSLVFAEMKSRVRDRAERYELTGTILDLPANEAVQAQGLRALVRLVTVWSRAPTMDGRPSEPTSWLLAAFQDQINVGRREAAWSIVRRLEDELRLDALNICFLEVQLFAAFEDWQGIVAMRSLKDLCNARRPPSVTNAIMEALFRVKLASAFDAEDLGALQSAYEGECRPWPNPSLCSPCDLRWETRRCASMRSKRS